MTSHPSQIPGAGTSTMSPDSENWSGSDGQGRYGSESVGDVQGQHFQPAGYAQGYAGVQKLTRDGQPAKRRGPKPDSKPAQTRRQELNRQAQRTHRERKEQYIKALEIEVARLREAFAQESANVLDMAKQHEVLLRENQQEIMILRDMLAARGIQFESELETRKANARMGGRDSSSISPSRMPGQPTAFHQPQIPPPPSSTGYSTTPEQTNYSKGSVMSATGQSPGTRHDSSPMISPEIQEQAHARSPPPVSDMPGIFEKDPQLGVDFILALEATCRDHGEYLVRRSAASPNDPDQAMFSGHALMATCPPPSHITSTPAQNHGLDPTYPHQTPQVPMDTLTKLLNLSQRMKEDGLVEGGQVTPIMALQSLRGHRNYSALTRDDVVGMIDAIKNKVRCYGFGAVMEDFELRDALTSIFATKPEVYEDLGGDADFDAMYS